MKVWRERADIYLAEIIRLEAPTLTGPCPGVHGRPCSSQDLAAFRCLSCSDPRLFCVECFLKIHQTLYLHRVQVSFIHLVIS